MHASHAPSRSTLFALATSSSEAPTVAVTFVSERSVFTNTKETSGVAAVQKSLRQSSIFCVSDHRPRVRSQPGRARPDQGGRCGIKMSVCRVKAILLLDSEGHRIYSKYYHADALLSTRVGQSTFEQLLSEKAGKMQTKPGETDVLMIDSYTAIFKVFTDVSLYLLGEEQENELMMQSLLETLSEALDLLYRGEVEKKNILESLELLMLAIDEMFESGMILCHDSQSIIEKVLMREGPIDPSALKGRKESALERAISSAKESISKTFIR